MYRHGAFSKSWSDFFSHGDSARGQLNQENKWNELIKGNTKAAEVTPLDNLEDTQIHRSKSLRNKFGWNKGQEVLIDETGPVATKKRISEEEKQGYLDNLEVDFGNQRDNFKDMMTILGNQKSQMYLSSPETTQTGSEVDFGFGRELNSGTKKIENQVTAIIPGMNTAESSIGLRKKVSSLFKKSPEETGESTFPESLNSKFEIRGSPDFEHGVTYDHRGVSKKSNLKLSKLTIQSDMERQIYNANPAISHIEFFPSSGAVQTNGRLSKIPFNWTFWMVKQVDDPLQFSYTKVLTKNERLDQVSEVFHLRIRKDLQEFITAGNNYLREKGHRIYLMRDDLQPLKRSDPFINAGTLEIKLVCHEARRQAVWEILINFFVSVYVFESVNVREPVVGIGWQVDETESIISLWLARNHADKTKRELLELSKLCHLLKDSLPVDLSHLMEPPNVIYRVSLFSQKKFTEQNRKTNYNHRLTGRMNFSR